MKSEKCDRAYVHRVTVGGKDRLVCEFIVYRILASAWISKEEGNGLVWTQRGNNVSIPVITSGKERDCGGGYAHTGQFSSCEG